jgi:hypothetical protein
VFNVIWHFGMFFLGFGGFQLGSLWGFASD